MLKNSLYIENNYYSLTYFSLYLYFYNIKRI